MTTPGCVDSPAHAARGWEWDPQPRHGLPCSTLRGALQKYIQLRPTTSQQHGAAFLGETQINILGGPSLEMANTPNLVQWHFQTHMTAWPWLTPSLVVVPFPTWTWFHSQHCHACIPKLWLHSQPGHGFIPHLAVAAQEALPRVAASKHPPSLAVRCVWAVRALSMQDLAKPRAHPRATQISIPNPAWSQSAPTTALSYVLTNALSRAQLDHPSQHQGWLS